MTTGENRFVFISPCRNAAGTLRQFLFSLAGQSYRNWSLVLIDDASTDKTPDLATRFARDFGIHRQVDVISNDKQLWEVANVLKGLRDGLQNAFFDQGGVPPDDIVCRIDPDDYLCDLDALRVINDVYNQTGCDALWTKHRWFDDKRVTSFNISGPMAEGADPYKHPWVSSHLKTFRKKLIDGVNDENFRGPDGKYIKRAGDQAIFLPILHRAQKRVFLPLVTYAYRCNMDPETFQTDDAKFQASEAEFLRSRGFVE